jgi:hypothetical protein
LERDFGNQLLSQGFASQQAAMQQALPYATSQYGMGAADQARMMQAINQLGGMQGQLTGQGQGIAGLMGSQGAGQIAQAPALAGYGTQNVLPTIQTGAGMGTTAAQLPMQATTAGAQWLPAIGSYMQAPYQQNLQAAQLGQSNINNLAQTMLNFLGQGQSQQALNYQQALQPLQMALDALQQQRGLEVQREVGMAASGK